MSSLEKIIEEVLTFITRFLSTVRLLFFQQKKLVASLHEHTVIKKTNGLYFFLICQVLFYTVTSASYNNIAEINKFSGELQSSLENLKPVQVGLIIIPGLVLYTLLIKLYVLLFVRDATEKTIVTIVLYYYSGIGLLIWCLSRFLETICFALIPETEPTLKWLVDWENNTLFFYQEYIMKVIPVLENAACILVALLFLYRLKGYAGRLRWYYLIVIVFCFGSYYVIKATSTFMTENYLTDKDRNSLSIFGCPAPGDGDALAPTISIDVWPPDSAGDSKLTTEFLIYNHSKSKVYLGSTITVNIAVLRKADKAISKKPVIKIADSRFSEKNAILQEFPFVIDKNHPNDLVTIDPESFYKVSATLKMWDKTKIPNSKFPDLGDQGFSERRFVSIVELMILRPKVDIEHFKYAMWNTHIDWK